MCKGSSSTIKWNDASTLKEDIENDLVNEPSDENKLIINGLATQDGDYVEGLGWLVYQVLANTKGGISDQTTGTTTMDGEGVFAVKFPDVTYQPMKTIYYKYQNNQWFWELDNSYEGGGVWQSVSTIAPGFNEDQKMIANALKSLDLNDGAALLFDYSSGDIQDLFEIGTEHCTDTCSSLGYQCGTQIVCGNNANCGSCTAAGQTCNSLGKCVASTGGTGTTTNREVFLITATDIQKFLGKTDIYYKYENAWKWTPYWKSFSENPDSIWISTISPVITTGDLAGKQPTNKNVEIIEAINGKSYADGKKILKDNDGTMEDGSEIVLGTTGTTTCTDTCSSLGYQCETQTVCGKNVDCGTCTVAGQTCNSLGKCVASTTPTQSPRQKVLDSLESLEGNSRSGLTDLDGSGGSPNCWDSVQYIYDGAGVTWDCIYSDNNGKTYTHDGIEIIMGVTENRYNQILYVTSTSCDNLGLSESAKLNLIQPGDILSIVFNEAAGHNVIFVEWDDKTNWKARVFDWGAFTGSRKFEYNIIDLNDNQYSVYRIWQPK
jgi:hypothetical protein